MPEHRVLLVGGDRAGHRERGWCRGSYSRNPSAKNGASRPAAAPRHQVAGAAARGFGGIPGDRLARRRLVSSGQPQAPWRSPSWPPRFPAPARAMSIQASWPVAGNVQHPAAPGVRQPACRPAARRVPCSEDSMISGGLAGLLGDQHTARLIDWPYRIQQEHHVEQPAHERRSPPGTTSRSSSAKGSCSTAPDPPYRIQQHERLHSSSAAGASGAVSLVTLRVQPGALQRGPARPRGRSRRPPARAGRRPPPRR